jgi:hypothetical protein
MARPSARASRSTSGHRRLPAGAAMHTTGGRLREHRSRSARRGGPFPCRAHRQTKQRRMLCSRSCSSPTPGAPHACATVSSSCSTTRSGGFATRSSWKDRERHSPSSTPSSPTTIAARGHRWHTSAVRQRRRTRAVIRLISSSTRPWEAGSSRAMRPSSMRLTLSHSWSTWA